MLVFPQPKAAKRNIAFINRLEQVVENNYQDQLFDISALSQRLHLCSMQVYRKIKANTGFTPGQYLLRFRLSKAIHLLQTTDYSIGEIAWKTGFSSHPAFTRSFKRVLNCSPQGLRNTLDVNVIK